MIPEDKQFEKNILIQELNQWRNQKITQRFLRILAQEKEKRINELGLNSINPGITSETLRLYAVKLQTTIEILNILTNDDIFTEKIITSSR